jgi:hypothetical protein
MFVIGFVFVCLIAIFFVFLKLVNVVGMVRDVFIDVIVIMEQHVMLVQEFVFVEWV